MAAVKFSKWKAFRKGIGPAIGAYFVGHMAGVDIGTILADPEKQIPVIAATLLAGLIPVIINTWKHRGAVGNPIPMLPILLALGVGMVAVQGCATTTHPDGTVVQTIDPGILQTAYDTWERYERRKVDLEREREGADAARRAQIDVELKRLAPELERAARTLGLRLE